MASERESPLATPVTSPSKSQWRMRLPSQNSPVVHPNTTWTQFHAEYLAGIFGIFLWRAEIRITGSPGEKGREGTIISTHICRNLVQASWRVAQKGAESGGEKADERPGIGGTANFSLGSPSIWKPGTGHTCRRFRYNRDLTFLIRLWITNVFNHLKVTTTLK